MRAVTGLPLTIGRMSSAPSGNVTCSVVRSAAASEVGNTDATVSAAVPRIAARRVTPRLVSSPSMCLSFLAGQSVELGECIIETTFRLCKALKADALDKDFR